MEEGTKAAVSETVLEQQGRETGGGDCLIRYALFWEAARRKEESPGTQTPAKDGKTAGETKGGRDRREGGFP